MLDIRRLLMRIGDKRRINGETSTKSNQTRSNRKRERSSPRAALAADRFSQRFHHRAARFEAGQLGELRVFSLPMRESGCSGPPLPCPGNDEAPRICGMIRGGLMNCLTGISYAGAWLGLITPPLPLADLR